MIDSILPSSANDQWAQHTAGSDSLPVPDGAEVVARLDHESGDHRIRVLSLDEGAITQWYAREQSMRREAVPELRLEQEWEVQTLEKARLIASVQTGMLTTMEARCEHMVRYAIDGPSDY